MNFHLTKCLTKISSTAVVVLEMLFPVVVAVLGEGSDGSLQDVQTVHNIP